MMLEPLKVGPFTNGWQTSAKPFLLPTDGLVDILNAYPYQGRIIKRVGNQFMGRLRRLLTGESLNVTLAQDFYNNGTTPAAIDIFETLVDITTAAPLRSTEPNAEIERESVTITIDAGGGSETIIEDANGTGILSATATNALNFTDGYINYVTGILNLNFAAPIAGGLTVDIDLNYFPSLPCMGIYIREINAVNEDPSVFFDTKYAYRFITGDFQELDPTFNWQGTDSDFFWCCNYRGATADTRLFFATNFPDTQSANNPIRYYDGATWNNFSPLIGAADNLYQARIILPYFGRLIALNTWEGTTAGSYAASTQFFNRCRFSAIGSPIAANAWRTDIAGQGGFIDAPVNEQIISASYFKNTLIVDFERSTWELRYVGEYGLPFIWERISSDFGCESPYSIVVFDDYNIGVSDKGITSRTSNNVARIDQKIQDLVFTFRNTEKGTKRVIGGRDFNKRLAYWTYVEPHADTAGDLFKFPSRVLVYNYELQCFAKFRDNVTFLGPFQTEEGVLWGDDTILWGDDDVTWGGPEGVKLFPTLACGNQQGYIHLFGYTCPDDRSMMIQDIDRTGPYPVIITSANHNLETGDIIQLVNIAFIDTSDNSVVANDFNDRIFYVSRIDDDTYSILEWDTTTQSYIEDFTFTPADDPNVELVCGEAVLFHNIEIQTKDFNPYIEEGKHMFLSYVDVLNDTAPSISYSVDLFAGGSESAIGNSITGNSVIPTATGIFNPPATQYLWQRFFATIDTQFLRLRFYFNDDQMNDIATQAEDFELNAIRLWTRPGGNIQF